MGDETFADDRWYGARYAVSAGDDLYLIAGRILSDLKIDQREDRMPPSAVFVVAVGGSTITVQVHLQNDADFERMGAESIRARAGAICERYNWKGRKNRADVRYKHQVQVRLVRGRLDASQLGSLLG